MTPAVVELPPVVNAGGYIYFALAAEANAVKIGTTRDVYTRLKTIRSNIPHEVTLIGAYWMPDAKLEETILHRRFRALRIRNEWFVAADEIVDLATWASAREFMRAPIEVVVERIGERRRAA